MKSWWWLSFAESHRWLGCTVVSAPSEVEAVRRAHALGVNPGGSVGIAQIETNAPPPPELFEHLVTDRVDAEVLARRWKERMLSV